MVVTMHMRGGDHDGHYSTKTGSQELDSCSADSELTWMFSCTNRYTDSCTNHHTNS